MQIRLEDVEHTYSSRSLQARTVLRIENWTVPSGAQVLLRGISGSGKTTLMNVLAGLLPPTQGRVQLNEQDLYALPEARRDRFRARAIGYIYQIHLLVPTLSAWENVEMPLVFAKEGSGRERKRKATDILAQLGLADHLDHKPVQMSAGQRLRVAVARALVTNPALVLGDEPTAALDRENAQRVLNLVQKSCRDRNATLLIASHDPALNSRFDQAIDLREGRLAEPPDTIITGVTT